MFLVTTFLVATALQAVQEAGTLAEAARSAGFGANAIVTAVRAEEPPVLDGLDADAIWQTIKPMDGFQQFEPDNDAPPSLPTDFRVAYDDRNLYVMVRAHDAHPDSIIRALSRRDVHAPADQISIAIDSYDDRRTGFQFAVNPDGVKYDLAIYDDDRRDSSWDGVWYVETAVTGDGWNAEFRIPLSQLRYPDAARHTFGFSVRRRIERFNETSTWPAIDRDRPGFVSQLGRLQGLDGLTSTRGVEVVPYTVAKARRTPVESAGFDNDPSVSFGADLKFRITPNLTLDATVNPDFGQVEADPADLNLTAFETFFSEKRPFFLEGTGLYRFALNCYIVVDCQTNEGLFYSRRIGRSPHLTDRYGDASTPTSTPIAAATKLTGRTQGGLSFGLLDAYTPGVEGLDDRSVEPPTNYAVFSAAQDFRDGDAGVQLIGTAVNRGLDQWTDPYLHSSAYGTGLSGRMRMGEGNYELNGLFALSRVEGSAAAIEATQRDAIHRFQQPGDGPELDPTRTNLSGSSVQLKLGKYGGGITRFETSLVRHSAGFDVNDLGYLRRADFQDWSTWSAIRFNDPTSVYRWLQINGNHWQSWTTSGDRIEGAFNANAHMGLHNNWDIHGGGTVGGLWGSACDRCTRGGPLLGESRRIDPWFGINGDNRRLLVPSMWVNLGWSDEGESRYVSLSPSLTVRFSTASQIRIGAGIRDNIDNTQWVGNFREGDDVHHAFARLDQRTLSMNVRFNYAATPDLTFEFYGEPFISSGEYTDVRELSATPEAADYVDRFMAYEPPASFNSGFTFRQLKTNAVLRWEYLPGSTLFLVWAHGREGSASLPSERGWRDEYRDLFDIRPEHTLLVKAAYWFNR